MGDESIGWHLHTTPLRFTQHLSRSASIFYFELRMGYNEMERETSDSLAARIAAEVYDGNN
jgi:hypothetical protein